MEYIILILVLILIAILLKVICKINIKQIMKLGENKELDEKINQYPSNIEVCKKILNKIGNESVKIEENKDASNCLYIVVSNKILIGDVKQSYTRIQTIAHECLHSIQDKTLLMFNFVYSNIYILAFFILAVLNICKVLPFKTMFLSIYILMGFAFYFIRSYLENDAMIKAPFLAKEYMEEENILSKEEIEETIEEYNKLNKKGIIATNYGLLLNVLVKTIILTLIMMI